MKRTLLGMLPLVILLASISCLKAQWGLSPDSLVLLNNGSTFGGGYVPYKFCTDGNNGVITTWVNGTHITAQRVDANGFKKWGVAGLPVYDSTAQPLASAIAEDGHGGCYIMWVNYAVVSGSASAIFFAQRLDSNGNALWQYDGIPVVFPNATNNFSATDLTVLNNNGNGAYLALEVGWNGGFGSVRAAKIDQNGKPLWDSSGVAVSIVGDFRGPKIISDGFGGMEMMYWSDATVAGNIKIQRLDANGNLKWGAAGKGLNTLYGITQETFNVSNGSNGAVFATWDGYLYNSGIYAQKLDTGGNFLWGATEIIVCDTPARQTYPDVISDGMGGAYFAWSDSRASGQPVRIYAQRLNANGTEQWVHNGIAVDTLNTYNPNPSLTPDVNNGVRVFWPSTQGGEHTLMQRLDTSGNAVCSPLGTRVTPFSTVTILYGNRSALHRNGGDLVLGYANFGLYVQYIPAGCNFPAAYIACDSLTGKFGYSASSAYNYQFIDSSVAKSGSVQNWRWDFGDVASGLGDTSSLQNPQHTFTAAGTYNICMVVTGGIVGSLCTDTVCAQIIINAPYNACDSLNVNYGFNSLSTYSYQFIDSSIAKNGNVQNWGWNFGDVASGTADTSSLQNIQHIFTAAGTYNVCLLVTGGVNGALCTDTVCKQVMIIGAGIEGVGDYSISTYPNPARENFNIMFTGPGDSKIVFLLTDISGRTLRSGTLKTGINAVDVMALANGLYFLKVTDGDGNLMAQRKMVVAK